MVKIDNTYPNNTIRVGENKYENDQIVKSAKDIDIWFHLSNLPSCHIVLEQDKQNPANKEMIKYCCQLAKDNTKYKNLFRVKVMYTEVRNVVLTDEPGKVIIKGRAKEIVI